MWPTRMITVLDVKPDIKVNRFDVELHDVLVLVALRGEDPLCPQSLGPLARLDEWPLELKAGGRSHKSQAGSMQ